MAVSPPILYVPLVPPCPFVAPSVTSHTGFPHVSFLMAKVLTAPIRSRADGLVSCSSRGAAAEPQARTGPVPGVPPRKRSLKTPMMSFTISRVRPCFELVSDLAHDLGLGDSI